MTGPDDELLSLTEIAKRLGTSPNGVRSMMKERAVLGVRRDGVGLVFPAAQLDTTVEPAVPVKHLRPVLTLLADAGYDAEESLRWLSTADDTLPGTPLQALHENRATEVKRRAQALGF